MDSDDDLDILGQNSSVKDINWMITSTGDLFIGVKVYVEPTTLLG